MKRLLFLPILFLSITSFGQGVTGAKPIIMDALGYEHISTDTLNKQAFTGLTAGNGIQIVAGVISVVQPTISFPTRTVNTNFTSSATKSALVYYSVVCTITNPALAGSSSVTVTLQYSTNGGTSFQDVAQISNLSSVALAVTVQLTNGQGGELVGIVPANALIRINSTTTGTASVSVAKSTEVIY
jgi:hypothetical protein